MVCLLAKALGFRIKFRVLIKYWVLADCLGFGLSGSEYGYEIISMNQVWVWFHARNGNEV